MQDRESQSSENPGIVQQGLDKAEEQGMKASGDDASGDGVRGGPIMDRERPDGGQITQREALDGPGQEGRENLLHGSRSGGSENTTGRSDPMPPAGGSSR